MRVRRLWTAPCGARDLWTVPRPTPRVGRSPPDRMAPRGPRHCCAGPRHSRAGHATAVRTAPPARGCGLTTWATHALPGTGPRPRRADRAPGAWAAPAALDPAHRPCGQSSRRGGTGGHTGRRPRRRPRPSCLDPHHKRVAQRVRVRARKPRPGNGHRSVVPTLPQTPSGGTPTPQRNDCPQRGWARVGTAPVERGPALAARPSPPAQRGRAGPAGQAAVTRNLPRAGAHRPAQQAAVTRALSRRYRRRGTGRWVPCAVEQCPRRGAVPADGPRRDRTQGPGVRPGPWSCGVAARGCRASPARARSPRTAP
ncbi:hypothetical protein J3A78_002916 [Streptomyces sp. PvR006]|nr:hypothetical protein [Streptomyces sp. PvR006]